MGRLEQEIRFTPAEQDLFELQRKTVEEWDIPQDILDQAHNLVEKRRAEVGKGYFALARKSQQPTGSLHFVAWEERVSNGEIFGNVGTITVSEDQEEIQCGLCGGWFKVLNGAHLQTHGLEDGDAYKSLLGLNRNQALCSPKFSALQREIAIENENERNIRETRVPFVQGFDPRRTDTRRRQFGEDRRRLFEEKRTRGELPSGRTSDRPEIRRLSEGGQFSLYGNNYYFGRTANGNVKITISGDEVTAEGYVNGELVTKTYQRKDL